MFNSLSPISLSTFSQFNFSAMANTKRSSHPFCPLTIDSYARALKKISSPTLAPKTEIGVTYRDVNPTSMLNTRNQPLAGHAEMNIFSNHEIDESHDGRIHSVPYIKNGPYTCPKCKAQFVTSQSFAAHATSSHYKYESKDQRRKRLMKRVRMRNLTLQKVSGALTVVPVSSEAARTAKAVEQGGKGLANAAGTSYVARFAYQDGGGLTKRVKVEGGLHSHYQVSPPGMEARGVGATGVKIKSERYA